MKIKCQPFAAAVAVLAAAVIIAGVARGETETIDGCTWAYKLSASGEVTITGASNIPEILDVPAAIDEHPVVTIGEMSFQRCTQIKKVSIPDSVKTIGKYAFQYCSGLENVTLGSGLKRIEQLAFESCTRLSCVSFSHGVSEIGIATFENCSLLETIALPSSIKSLDWQVFKNCPSLRTVYLHASFKGNVNKNWFEDSPSATIVYYNCKTPIAPPAVENLSATNDGPQAIRVNWDFDDGVEVSEFKIYRSATGDFEGATLVAEVGGGCFDDYDVAEGADYFYWVVPVNDIFVGKVSGSVCGSCVGPLEIVATGTIHGVELSDFMQELSVVSGSDNVGWYVDGDENLPPGIELSGYGALGVLSGVPTQYGTYTFTIHCKDSRFESSDEATAEITMEILENDNRKPLIEEYSPVDVADVVLKDVTQQEFTVLAHDPDGQDVSYVWTIDGEEVLSGIQATNLVFDSFDYTDNSRSHEIVCYVNDDLWTNIVHRKWMVYVPKEIHIDLDDNDYAYALQSAIDDSTPYDMIHVPAGRYVGWGIPHPLTIVADDGPTNTVIEGRISFDEYNWRTPGKVTLRGFTLTGKIDSMFYESVYSNLSLERCIIVNGGIDRDNWWEDENQDDDSYDEYEETDNVETVRGLFVNCSLDRCTVANNCVDPEILPIMTNCVCSGTIVWGNEGAENDAQDPVFVSLSNGDYRLRTSSPYIANGIATRGALDDVVSGHVISASVVGPGSLDKMTAAVADGGNVTFSVMNGSHPLDHFEVNGERVAAKGGSCTIANIQSDVALTAFFVSNITFYVDAENGSDAADGFTKATAVVTLQEAVDRTVDGDTIIVADGTYAPIHVGNKRITIESENGYKTTIIDGGGTNGCMYATYSIWDTPSTNAVLRGFTLANGFSYRGAGVCGGTLERCLIVDNVAFNEGPGYGAAYYYGQGGGAYGSTLRHCTVVGNTAELWPGYEWEGAQASGGEGGGVCGCTIENCIVYGNEGEAASNVFNTAMSSDSFVGVDPLFADSANGDYRLMSNSPCVVDGVATVGCETEVVEPKTLYVDAENGNDAADGLSKANAVKTLQIAINRALTCDTILVADGVYAPIETHAKRIIIESENGYRATIIDGGWTNRCVYAGGNGYGDFYWTDASTVLRGFTLRNGRSTFGGGAIGGTLERCLIVNCSATLPDVDDHYDLGNWASPFGVGGGAYDSTLFYCTVVGNIAEYWEGNEYSLEGRGGKGGGVYGCTLENCIVYGNEGVVAPDESNSECSSDSFVGVDPLFVNAANGDYRLMSNSPCVVAGVATAGCETEVVSGTMPELTSEQAESWVSEYLAVRYVKSGETAVDYQSRFEAKFGSDLVAAMAKPTDKKDAQGNAMYVWQDYVAGTDPTDTNSVFTAKINMVDGAPVISWEPELPPEQAALRTYTIYGKTNLTDQVWHSSTNSSSRFFRIGVELR